MLLRITCVQLFSPVASQHQRPRVWIPEAEILDGWFETQVRAWWTWCWGGLLVWELWVFFLTCSDMAKHCIYTNPEPQLPLKHRGWLTDHRKTFLQLQLRDEPKQGQKKKLQRKNSQPDPGKRAVGLLGLHPEGSLEWLSRGSRVLSHVLREGVYMLRARGGSKTPTGWKLEVKSAETQWGTFLDFWSG